MTLIAQLLYSDHRQLAAMALLNPLSVAQGMNYLQLRGASLSVTGSRLQLAHNRHGWKH
jgi:hypothetical protein